MTIPIQDAVIREIEAEDISPLVKSFVFSSILIEAILEKWTRYYHEHLNGMRTIFILEKKNEIIGYASLLRVSNYPHFQKVGIPEIHDLRVAEKWRKLGYGKRLIEHLEQSARLEGYSQIGIGVGLYADYGSAQRLYFRLGYIPDGYGVTYHYLPAVAGETYPLDDELILWLIKKI